MLISSSKIMNVDPLVAGRNMIVSRYAAPECPTPWSVRNYRYFGGKQEQINIVWIDNGKLQIAVIATRGLGILTVLMDEHRILGWDSPVKDIVHPSLINLESRGGLGWLEGFNEWLCRCGMEWNGQPGTDRFINNRGEEDTMELTLHGRVANLPTQELDAHRRARSTLSDHSQGCCPRTHVQRTETRTDQRALHRARRPLVSSQ